jgi:hypothetical protein
MSSVVQPMLDVLCAYMGFHITMLCGMLPKEDGGAFSLLR